ncbi:DNRLRE domain-containing protein [Actinophytocola algeriensis]|uniref:RHS repeat-associated protein n=1 Tax=Actinophytocola algeriensis TaxID=1768010 RepID=A0A7W7Q925_9PSEU|nr:DNRLRE domain-containing protein [Actinophytocola algeriensis]MBB4908876.1 RHS repeat-associated protein [Actinophytocola algeriensis]MBE1474736.1 RHS repeat-associated protein [Actinophytocola algeriensis]
MPERASASTRVFAMSDGTFEAEVSPEPQRYRDASGAWRAIDLSVRESVRDGYRFASDRNNSVVRFGERTDQLVRFEHGGRQVALSAAVKGRPVAPRVDGATVTYPGVFDGADVEYVVTPEGVKENIVLAGRVDDPTFEFTVRTAGVVAREQADGSIGFFSTDTPDGPPVFVFPRPFMTDSVPDAKSPTGTRFSDEVTQSVEQQGANATVTVRADKAWLDAADRRYPVRIDPTIRVEPTPTTGQDAQIWSDTPTRADGALYSLSVGTDPWGRARSLLRFDTSTVPAGTALTGAKLRLYYDNELHTGANNVTIEARRVTQSWAEDTVTWNSINAAMGEAGLSTVVKQANKANVWHEWDIRNIAQSWVATPTTNYGVMVKATDETLGRGGAVYQAAEYAYNGETVNRPKLVLTYGRPSVDLQPPATVTATGANLSWPAYVDPTPTDPNDDVVELQVHRTVFQTFTPSRSTLIAPLPATATAFNDTTAAPTPANDPDPFGNAYYYMVAAKTRDGQLIPGPTQLVRLPKAGLITHTFTGSAADTTIASNATTTNLDVLTGQPWLMVGNNSTTYGNTRALVRFDNLNAALPAGARIVDADMTVWGFYSDGSGATFDAHALSKPFVETQATWARASTATAWTTAGGDFGARLDQVVGIPDQPFMHIWENTPVVQGWVDNPATNHGYLLKVRDEAGAAKQRVLMLSGEAPEVRLRPSLTVTYTAPTAELTYHAPDTPTVRMVSDEQRTVPVTVTNTTTTTWRAADYALSQKWALPDGTDITGTNRIDTALPGDVAPGQTVTVAANVKTTLQGVENNMREQQVLSWDLRNKNTGAWLSATGGPPALPQNVSVEDPTSDELGLEKFYSYSGTATGAGSNLLVNQYAGNVVFSYDAFTNPGRGLNTFLRLTYNSLDTATTTSGYGWSLAASGLVRLGASLELHPKGQDYPSRVTLPDGDGTTHVFLLDKHGSVDPAVWTYVSPKGVHLYLQRREGEDTSRRWVMTSPDRTEFWFDAEGWLSAVRDRNGNEQSFTYTERKSNNQPRKFLAYVTDPAGRQTMVLDYYTKTDTQNPHIIDQVKSIRDISGRTLTFAYSDKGLLTDIVDGAGSTQPKPFHFDYDATQGNKNVKLVRVTDPRGNHTDLAYYTAPVDPQDKWKVHTITDRRNNTTTFTYSDPDGPQGAEMDATVTDAENHTTSYHMDGFGRPVTSVNAKNETTTMEWDADHNVVSLTEDNDAVSTWRYDPKTGYPLEIRDAEAVANNTPATVLTYQTRLDGYTAELASKTSPEGRQWAFSYDPKGNLTHVTDPKGVATPEVGDYQTVYSYDQYGQLQTVTDANSNTTTYGDYHPAGFPRSTTDPLTHTSTMVLDPRGNPTSLTDARQKASSATYDTFGRPLETRVPKDQAAGEYITTLAPVYDANDNIERATAPNGAVTTATYDPMDQPVTVTAPRDTPTGPARVSTFTYDKVGNLLTRTEPLGTLTPADLNDYVTRYTYDPIYQLTDTVDAAGNTTTYRYDNVGNVTTIVDPRKNTTTDTEDYTAKYAYDRNHRQRTTTDPDGNVTKVDYDRDSNVVSQTDAENNTTTLVYDERASLIEARVPHKTAVTRTTKFVYDEVGNRIKTITPRGVETTDDPDDFVAETIYDQLNRPKEKLTPFDRDHAEIKTPDKTIYTYDPVGNLAEVSMPPSAGQTVRNVTKYSYFDNGWQRTSTDPWGIETRYDYNALGQQTLRTLTSAGGSSDRTMIWDYYPDGKLKSRSDSGTPVGKQEVVVDNSDSPRVTFIGPGEDVTTRDTSGTGYHGYDYGRAPAGTFTWNPVVPSDGTYEVFVRYPVAANGAQFGTYTVDTGSSRTSKNVNQTQGGGTWVSLGRHQLTAGTAAKVELSDDVAPGDLLADAVKLVRDNTGVPDNEAKTFIHAYDANANLTTLTDASPGTPVDNYQLAYNGLNQLTKVEEKLATTIKNTTLFTYNENGAIQTRDHDRQDAVFDYNTRDLLEKVTNTETGGTPKATAFTYTPRGQIDVETKANGNTVDHGYHLDGAMASQVEKKTDGTLVAQHLIEYTPNGNRATDHTKIQNADDHAAYLDHIYNYTYDPRERLSDLAKKTPGGTVVESETYRHDANNNVIDQTVDGTPTQFTYDRNRLVTTTSGGSTAAYNYDPFGRLDTVMSAGQIIEQYVYDGFDRTTTHRKRDSGGGLTSTNYTYDPLDRTTAKTDKAGTPEAKTTDFAYLGLTDTVVAEEIAGQLDRTYQYDAYGRRLAQSTKDTDGTGPEVAEDTFYGYNPHTDVETLTTQAGDTKTTYGYTAYGKDDEQAFTGIDKPDTQNPSKEPFNFYRYTGKRFDPASGGYDMGFRDYQPGINRFTVRDTYNGALADLNLGTNPWTGNRYTMAGGNPITGIEIDGHYCDSCNFYDPDSAAGSSVGCSYSTNGYCGPSGSGHSEEEQRLLHQWRTGTGDGSNQPIIHGHRLPTAEEMQQSQAIGMPIPMAPGDTYQQAVTNWATYTCNSGKANPGFCEWSYTVGNEKANGWDALWTIAEAALLAVPGGRGVASGASTRVTQAVDDAVGAMRAAGPAKSAVPSVADVTALVPTGQTLATWGNQIWGTGAQGAKALIGTRSAAELARIPGLNVQSATTLRNFYQGAANAGKGGATAPVRVQLLDDIIKTLGG